MTMRSWSTLLVTLLVLAASAGGAVAQTFDVGLPPGDNYQQAQFRLWVEEERAEPLRGLLVLVPGSNSDGRSSVEDPLWRDLARAEGFGLVGAYWTDRRHPEMAAEHYVDVARGSGAALLEALRQLSVKSERPEVATVPLLLWGMSAGGQFNYEFALWRPDRVLGFVVNKGGIYYHSFGSPEARTVPGLFFVGERDMAFRNDIIYGIFSVNRRFRARWALITEPGIGHAVGRSKVVAAAFFREWIRLRLPSEGGEMRPLPWEVGVLGDPQTREFVAAPDAPRMTSPRSWLASEDLAKVWAAATSGEDVGTSDRPDRD